MVIVYRYLTKMEHSFSNGVQKELEMVNFYLPVPVSDVDSQGNVWVADRGNHRIQKFDGDGNFLFKFGNTDGHPSSALGKFDNPRQVSVDKDVKFLYVADSKNNRVQKFDTNGNFVKSRGSKGTGDGQFDLPISLIIDSKGNIIVNVFRQ